MSGAPLVVGLSWRTAPVAIRERLALRDDELPEALAALRAVPGLGEAMLVSTCNRVEAYGVAGGEPGQVAEAVRGRLLALRGVAPDGDVAAAMYVQHGEHAVRHVFRVSAALDSLVLGEAQILGQLKEAFAAASAAGAVGPLLGRWMERAFGVAKRVRTETAVARGAANVSSVAVELAARVFGALEGRRVLVVGAGKMSTLAARRLRAAGVAELMVTNRSLDRAQRLAAELGGLARPWDQLEALLGAADVVISSTGARAPILGPELMKRVVRARRYRPVMVVDIAVPRDANPAIGRLEGVYLFDIDDLEKVVAANLADRARAADDAGRIVETEVAQFGQWLASQHVVPTIRALREHFAAVAETEAARLVEQLRRREHTADERDEAVRRMAQLLVAKLLHAPQTALKAARPGHAEALVAAAADLFPLAPPAAPSAEPAPRAAAEAGKRG